MIPIRTYIAAFLTLFPLPPASYAAPRSVATVSQCKDVTLHASYLVEEKSGQGPGFLVTISNKTKSSIRIVDPAPLSVHWYAYMNGHWLWRASSGSGGSLMNAFRESGPLFAQQVSPGQIQTRSILPGASYTWAVFSGADASLAYRPGCEHCAYSGEAHYQAVLAYAVQVPEAVQYSTLLHCGLRSNPIVMPDLQATPVARSPSPR
jgi:hypothetical protein